MFRLMAFMYPFHGEFLEKADFYKIVPAGIGVFINEIILSDLLLHYTGFICQEINGL